MGVKIIPALDWIVVKLAKDVTQVARLIQAPPTAREPIENVFWHVLAVGPGRPSEYTGELICYGTAPPPPPGTTKTNPVGKRMFAPVKEGDLILASSGAGTKYVHPDLGPVRLMRPSDVLATVEMGE